MTLHAATLCETWCHKSNTGSHPGTLRITAGKQHTTLVFDLSAIPKGSTIHAAWLYHSLSKSAQPKHSIQIFPMRDATIHRTTALLLDPPWYNRFDVSTIVQQWVQNPKSNYGFAVQPFPGFKAQQMQLRISYTGVAKNLPAQVARIRVIHHHGQTFITWQEHHAFRPQKADSLWVSEFAERNKKTKSKLGDTYASGPGTGAYGLPHHPAISLATLRKLQGLIVRTKPTNRRLEPMRRTHDVPNVSYHIYRHHKPINANNIHQASYLHQMPALSGYDHGLAIVHYEGEFNQQHEDPLSTMPVFAIAKNTTLAHDEGLYVHTNTQAGKFYYAVCMSINGQQNLVDFSAANSLSEAVSENINDPQPVLQWIQEEGFNADMPEHWHCLWTAPPFCNLPSKRLRVLVCLNKNIEQKRPLKIQGFTDDAFEIRNMGVKKPHKKMVTLKIQDQVPWMPQICYSTGRDTLKAMDVSQVDYFPERCVSHIIDWCIAQFPVDRSRIEGDDIFFGMRRPDLFPKIFAAGYTTTYDYRWAPGSPASVVGPQGVKTVDGLDAWSMFSVEGFLKKDPGRDVPFFIFTSSTGKDRGHTMEFGWQDDPRGWYAMQKYRQPFIAFWSTGKRMGPIAYALNKIDWQKSLPAFSNCSLDNNPGNGEAADGDYYGQINGWLIWDNKQQVDDKDNWELNIKILKDCPQNDCLVD
ncbi:MAG: hypothetical protein HRU15_15045, partial [Planctomycetes bacterium]|nr:hypothetical protein [Planctomycetota bacterium]